MQTTQQRFVEDETQCDLFTLIRVHDVLVRSYFECVYDTIFGYDCYFRNYLCVFVDTRRDTHCGNTVG